MTSIEHKPARKSLWAKHKIFETNSIILVIGVLLVISIGGLVEIAPLFYLRNTIETVQGMASARFCPAWSSRATQRLSSADFSTPRNARCTGSTRSAMPYSADFICSFYRSSGDNIAMDLQTRIFTRTPPR